MVNLGAVSKQNTKPGEWFCHLAKPEGMFNSNTFPLGDEKPNLCGKTKKEKRCLAVEEVSGDTFFTSRFQCWQFYLFFVRSYQKLPIKTAPTEAAERKGRRGGEKL